MQCDSKRFCPTQMFPNFFVSRIHVLKSAVTTWLPLLIFCFTHSTFPMDSGDAKLILNSFPEAPGSETHSRKVYDVNPSGYLILICFSKNYFRSLSDDTFLGIAKMDHFVHIARATGITSEAVGAAPAIRDSSRLAPRSASSVLRREYDNPERTASFESAARATKCHKKSKHPLELWQESHPRTLPIVRLHLECC